MARPRLGERALDWLDRRYDVRYFLVDRVLLRRMPSGSPWWYRFGILAAFALLVQFASGLALLVQYVPTPEGASGSINQVQAQIPFGWFVRGAHAAGAMFLVGLAALYLLAVVLRGLHKAPREINWMVLVMAFLTVLAMAYTGRVLPWDDAALASVTAGANLVRQIPGLGSTAANWLVGGDVPDRATLRRVLAFHVALGPFIVLSLVFLYVRLVRLTGHQPVEEG
ncbi:MAG: cytochrome bc complex cytochrome b subunit [Planctomycetes bacterium]|nr:cytochrome bc complex cytochrome b subunit [Planctomycetota bacterium]